MPTIIAATDGSPSANAAVERALAEASASNATLELVGAWSAPPNGTLGAPTYMSEDVFYAARDGIARILEDARARAAERAIPVETHLVGGSAAVEICKLGEKLHAGPHRHWVARPQAARGRAARERRDARRPPRALPGDGRAGPGAHERPHGLTRETVRSSP